MERPYTESMLNAACGYDKLREILDLDFGYTTGTDTMVKRDLVNLILELQLANMEDDKFGVLAHFKEFLPMTEQMITDAFYTSSVAFRQKYLSEVDSLNDEDKKQMYYKVRDIVISNKIAVLRPGSQPVTIKKQAPKSTPSKKIEAPKVVSVPAEPIKEISATKITEPINQLPEEQRVLKEEKSSDPVTNTSDLSKVPDIDLSKAEGPLMNPIGTNDLAKATPQTQPVVEKRLEESDEVKTIPTKTKPAPPVGEKKIGKGKAILNCIDMLVEEGADINTLKPADVINKVIEVYDITPSNLYASTRLKIKREQAAEKS